MKNLTITLLFFITLNSFNNVFASSKFEKLKDLIETYNVKEKLSEINIKLSHIFCDDNVSNEEQTRVIQEIENTFTENHNNPYFINYGIELCDEYIKSQNGQNYKPKPEHITSANSNIRFLFEVYKLKGILENKDK